MGHEVISRWSGPDFFASPAWHAVPTPALLKLPRMSGSGLLLSLPMCHPSALSPGQLLIIHPSGYNLLSLLPGGLPWISPSLHRVGVHWPLFSCSPYSSLVLALSPSIEMVSSLGQPSEGRASPTFPTAGPLPDTKHFLCILIVWLWNKTI